MIRMRPEVAELVEGAQRQQEDGSHGANDHEREEHLDVNRGGDFTATG